MTTTPVRTRRIHPAWIVAIVAFLALVGAAGFRAAPSVLMLPLEAEFGWTRTQLSLAVTVNLLLYGLMAPFAAALMARFGLRKVTSVALVLVSAGAALSIFATEPWMLVLTWGVLIGLGTGASDLGDGTGVALALVAAVTYAAGVLLQKPALKRLPNAQVTWLGCAIGLVACLPFTGDLIRDLADAPPQGILGMLYLGAIPTALAFSTWAYALSRMPAGQLGVSTYIVPPLAVIMGVLVFQEVPAVLAVVGGVVCLVGVALSRRRTRIPEPAETMAE